MKKITILVPAYNEGRNLPALIAALAPLTANTLTTPAYEWEVLVVDDGSRDDTRAVMAGLRSADPRISCLSLSRNFGKENAMLAGLDYATGDAVVIIDADLQHPVDVIPQMIAAWEEGYDDVYGRRADRKGESWLRRKFTKAYYSLLQRSTHVDILPDVGDFRLLDRRCVAALRCMRESQRYSKGLFTWIGFNKKEIIYRQHERAAGKSSFSYGRLFNLALDGLTSFTTAPLRFASCIGFVTAVLAIAYLVYTFVRTALYGDPVAGYPTIICVMLFLGACQLISLGIIGEYISRIFIESKRRPPYIADTFNGEPQDNAAKV